jgi:hypothetical protein
VQKCPAALKNLGHENAQWLGQAEEQQKVSQYLKNTHRGHIKTAPVSAARRGDR